MSRASKPTKQQSSKRRPSVLLPYVWQDPSMLRGISRYAREANWHLVSRHRAVDDELLFEADRWAGVFVGMTVSPQLMARFQNLARKCPTVVLGRNCLKVSDPSVHEDDCAAGRRAADYFLQRGYRHFGWYSVFHDETAQQRREAFRSAVEDAGRTFLQLDDVPVSADGITPWRQRRNWIGKRLRAAPRPLAVLAVDDYRAEELLEICLDTGLRVPEEVAILGMGNTITTCEDAEVPLSSIAFDYEGLAYAAAELLGRRMNGAPPPKAPLIFPPTHIITRASTLSMVVTEPRLKAVLQFIDDHLRENIGIAELAAAASVSRGTLHNLCIEYLHQSPARLLLRRRLERASQMLKERGEDISTVAMACGFASLRTLNRCFHRELGMSPRAYRLQL